MTDPAHHHLAAALSALGERIGSLTALCRELRLPEATVRRWARGLALPPPDRWRELCAALEREGLGDEVPALAGELAADIAAAYGLGPALGGGPLYVVPGWPRWVCLTCGVAVLPDEDGACDDCGHDPIEAPHGRAEELLLEASERIAVLEQTSGELCDVCGWRARWPSPEGGMPCRLCADGGGQ